MRSKRPLDSRNSLRLLVFIGIAAVGATGCGKEPTEPDANPDFMPDFMVGDWLADALVLTSLANPEVFTDLVADLGAVFTLSVQPSGPLHGDLVGVRRAVQQRVGETHRRRC